MSYRSGSFSMQRIPRWGWIYVDTLIPTTHPRVQSAVGMAKHVIDDPETVARVLNPKRTPQPTLAMRFSVPRSLSPSPVRKARYSAHSTSFQVLLRSHPNVILLGHPARAVPSALHPSHRIQKKTEMITPLQATPATPLNLNSFPCPCAHNCHIPNF